MIDSPAAKAFVEQILTQSGTGANLDDATRQELVTQMLEQLTHMVNAELISTLNAHQMRHVEHLLDTGHQAAIEKYLESEGISNHEVVARAMRRFQQEYLGS